MGIAVGAIAIRFYQLTGLSLWPLEDEAMSSHYALELARFGHWQWTYDFSGLPPLYIWILGGRVQTLFHFARDPLVPARPVFLPRPSLSLAGGPPAFRVHPSPLFSPFWAPSVSGPSTWPASRWKAGSWWPGNAWPSSVGRLSTGRVRRKNPSRPWSSASRRASVFSPSRPGRWWPAFSPWRCFGKPCFRGGKEKSLSPVFHPPVPSFHSPGLPIPARTGGPLRLRFLQPFRLRMAGPQRPLCPFLGKPSSAQLFRLPSLGRRIFEPGAGHLFLLGGPGGFAPAEVGSFLVGPGAFFSCFVFPGLVTGGVGRPPHRAGLSFPPVRRGLRLCPVAGGVLPPSLENMGPGGGSSLFVRLGFQPPVRRLPFPLDPSEGQLVRLQVGGAHEGLSNPRTPGQGPGPGVCDFRTGAGPFRPEPFRPGLSLQRRARTPPSLPKRPKWAALLINVNYQSFLEKDFPAGPMDLLGRRRGPPGRRTHAGADPPALPESGGLEPDDPGRPGVAPTGGRDLRQP